MKKTYCNPTTTVLLFSEELPLASSNTVNSKNDETADIIMNPGTMESGSGDDAAIKLNPVDWNE